MKINSVNFSNPVQNIYKKTQMIEEKHTSNFQNKDSIEISDIGKSLSEMSMNGESINFERVNDIKSKIETGTYYVDSRELAKKIISGLNNEKSQL